MAQRRMFSKSVVDSDDFIDLPLTAQAIYFHLAMRADDDGFVGNPKSTMRMIGGNMEDFLLLEGSGLIRTFKSGVVLIVHWKEHNYIPKDRYKATVYKKEKAEVEKVYDLISEDKDTMDTVCIQSVYNLDTQDRIGKDRQREESTGKDREASSEESSEEKTQGKADKKDSEHIYARERIFSLYNEICTSLIKATTLDTERSEQIDRLLLRYSEQQIEQVFRKANASSYLQGRGRDAFRGSIDWLTKEKNFIKVMEGNYDSAPRGDSRECSYDHLEFEGKSMFD